MQHAGSIVLELVKFVPIRAGVVKAQERAGAAERQAQRQRKQQRVEAERPCLSLIQPRNSIVRQARQEQARQARTTGAGAGEAGAGRNSRSGKAPGKLADCWRVPRLGNPTVSPPVYQKQQGLQYSACPGAFLPFESPTCLLRPRVSLIVDLHHWHRVSQDTSHQLPF